VCEQLRFEPIDWVIVPVGMGTNLSYIWKGFKEYYEFGFIKKLPKIIAVQAEGACPIVTAYETKSSVKPIDKARTICSAIACSGVSIDAPKVMAALKEAGMRQLGYKDVKIKFYIDSEAVGGESAGIAIALATLALLTDKETKEYVAATGTIDRDGTIGKVGGILQKAEAASKKNTRVLLIPRGEGEITAITPHYFIDPETGKRVGKGEPIERKINVIKEARSRWNLEVQQVATLSEAKKYVFK